MADIEMSVKIESVGPSLDEMHEREVDAEGARQLAEVHLAMDVGGFYEKTGHLKQSLRVARIAGGAELHGPPDRLRTVGTRAKFIELLAQWIRVVR